MFFLAYLDPGTGSYLLQLVLGLIFGTLFFLKMFWRRLLGLLPGHKNDNEDPDS